MFKKLLFFFALILLATGIVGYRWIKDLTPERIFQSSAVQKQVKKKLGDEGSELVKFLPRFLGFTKPMTYLLLFENNTELRPGGGFIGSYAVLKINKGRTELVKIEGTEVLDSQAAKNILPEPPKPIKDHLKVSKWYFRDSNWSPDFAESAGRALELYGLEKGVSAGEIDIVVAFTPTVLEELMKITGAIEVENIEFTSQNVTEKLEYEVEYGYDERGQVFHERKAIMKPFLLALLRDLKFGGLAHWESFLSLGKKLVQEKQIAFYSPDVYLQSNLDGLGLTGRVMAASGDYLMWVDANLAALKTDHAIKRDLKYTVASREDGQLVAIAEMTYMHSGKFDWRTTRYRSYARVFVPAGSKLLSCDETMKWDRTPCKGTVDHGEELGKRWFGAFIAIEPGGTGKLSFIYLLPESVSKQVQSGLYTILVQKQLGLVDMGLTIDVGFGTMIGGGHFSGILKEDKKLNFQLSTVK